MEFSIPPATCGIYGVIPMKIGPGAGGKWVKSLHFPWSDPGKGTAESVDGYSSTRTIGGWARPPGRSIDRMPDESKITSVD